MLEELHLVQAVISEGRMGLPGSSALRRMESNSSFSYTRNVGANVWFSHSGAQA
jgi:hypothetical protein